MIYFLSMDSHRRGCELSGKSYVIKVDKVLRRPWRRSHLQICGGEDPLKTTSSIKLRGAIHSQSFHIDSHINIALLLYVKVTFMALSLCKIWLNLACPRRNIAQCIAHPNRHRIEIAGFLFNPILQQPKQQTATSNIVALYRFDIYA